MVADKPSPQVDPFDPALVLATCGGLGWIPWAPGTFGSLAGLPLAVATGAFATWFAYAIGSSGTTTVVAIEIGIIALLFLGAVPIATRAARLLGGKDPGPVVIDEAVAIPLALVGVAPQERGLAALTAAFVLFRIFDIAKPPPCRRLERLPGGLGIMADDQAAAVFGAACLAIARWRGWL